MNRKRNRNFTVLGKDDYLPKTPLEELDIARHDQFGDDLLFLDLKKITDLRGPELEEIKKKREDQGQVKDDLVVVHEWYLENDPYYSDAFMHFLVQYSKAFGVVSG